MTEHFPFIAKLLCCEGPQCNGGISAPTREELLESRIVSLYGGEGGRAEAFRVIRSDTTHALAVTPHTHVGYARGAAPVWACTKCGWERQWGGAVCGGYLTSNRIMDEYRRGVSESVSPPR